MVVNFYATSGLYSYFIIGFTYFCVGNFIRFKKLKIITHIMSLLVHITLWPLIILSMYKRHKVISNVLKPHYRWKLLLFGKVHMRDSKDQIEYENSSRFSYNSDDSILDDPFPFDSDGNVF